jgi:hypothetical protein
MRMERWNGVAGLVFLLLLVPAVVLEILGPDPADSPATVAAKFASDRTQVLIACVLLLGAAVALLIFAIGLAGIARRGGDARLACALVGPSAVVGVGVFTIYIATYASLAASIHSLHDAGLVFAAFRSAFAVDYAADLFFGMFAAASSLALAGTSLSGRWFTRFGVFAGVFYAIGALSITAGGHGPFSLFDAGGTVLVLAWVAVISVRLVAAKDTPGVPRPVA